MELNYSTSGLYITPEIRTLLGSVSKWARFLSILIFVYLILSAVSILSAGVMITSMNSYAIETQNVLYHPGVFSWGYATALLLALVVYFVPTYFMYKFATNLKRALETDDNEKLTVSFQFLQKNYKFIGVLAIIILVLFLILFLVMLIGMLFG